jgi:hypothetical protein
VLLNDVDDRQFNDIEEFNFEHKLKVFSIVVEFCVLEILIVRNSEQLLKVFNNDRHALQSKSIVTVGFNNIHPLNKFTIVVAESVFDNTTLVIDEHSLKVFANVKHKVQSKSIVDANAEQFRKVPDIFMTDAVLDILIV